ncbi:hypothetical protein PUNSTDRAFT_137388 [Punctularia strigosozonata HHB-11173 SS5]|uniref:uncharacterized protein n=1 Tax=Punctularia strigosozonata (strain HHB-11173) TaxID=741275 RepID=UPI0004416A0F|nr:uncharacterized protein PUNSTDRAFT_137388 [Punctularia strigosozonata HHB-11173 SS5]EIN05903.1 hypothetical protein PUNSTDRAFT_137388 [Punctularia strigosozonata HHB-11173 SS5]
MPPAPELTPARRRRRRRKPWTPKRKPKPTYRERNIHEVTEITDEADDEYGKWYLVEWAGIDPRTGGPWPPDWIHERGMRAPECLKRWQVEKRRRLYNKLHSRTIKPKRIPSAELRRYTPFTAPTLYGHTPTQLRSCVPRDDVEHCPGTDEEIPVFYEGHSGPSKDDHMDIDQALLSETRTALEPDDKGRDGSDEDDMLQYPPDEELKEGFEDLFDSVDLDADPEVASVSYKNSTLHADFAFDDMPPLPPITYAPINCAAACANDRCSDSMTKAPEAVLVRSTSSIPEDGLSSALAGRARPRTVCELARLRYGDDYDQDDGFDDEDSVPESNDDLPMHLPVQASHVGSASQDTGFETFALPAHAVDVVGAGEDDCAEDVFLDSETLLYPEEPDSEEDAANAAASTSQLAAPSVIEDRDATLPDKGSDAISAGSKLPQAPKPVFAFPRFNSNENVNAGIDGQASSKGVQGLIITPVRPSPSELQFTKRRISFAGPPSGSLRSALGGLGVEGAFGAAVAFPFHKPVRNPFAASRSDQCKGRH